MFQGLCIFQSLKPNSRMYPFSEKILLSFLALLGPARALCAPRGKKIEDNHLELLLLTSFSLQRISISVMGRNLSDYSSFFMTNTFCSGVFSIGATGALAPVILEQSITVTAILGQPITVSTRNSKVLNTPLHHLFSNL